MNKKIFFIYLNFFFLVITANNGQVENAYFQLAESLKAENNHEESFIYYQKALERNENHLPTLFSIGKLFLDKDDYDNAIEHFKKRLELKSNCAQTEFLLANAFSKKKDLDSAITHYKSSISINPKFITAYQALINTFQEQKKINVAIEICKKAIINNPESVNIRIRLINFLKQQKIYDEALSQCDQLIKIQPSNDNHKMKKAHILALNNLLNESLELFKYLLQKHPNNPSIIFNIAHLNKRTGNLDQAIERYIELIKINPKHRKAHLELGQSYIAQGNFEPGWNAIDKFHVITKSQTILNNLTDVSGKNVLIKGEWSASDMIQFIRYAKMIKQLEANVIVQTPKQLEALFKNCPYIDKMILIDRQESCVFNKQIPIISLAKLFETTPENIPCEIPYIHAPQELVNYWEEKLKHDKKIKIGLFAPENSGIPLRELGKIANIESLSVYILHKANNNELLQELSFDKIVHSCGKGFEEIDNDLLNIAALMKNLDLVITCDSAIAHLAGAMGVSVWVMLPYVANWRWMTDLDYSPWYPTMRLFRQKEPGNWQSVTNEIISCLEEITASS